MPPVVEPVHAPSTVIARKRPSTGVPQLCRSSAAYPVVVRTATVANSAARQASGTARPSATTSQTARAEATARTIPRNTRI